MIPDSDVGFSQENHPVSRRFPFTDLGLLHLMERKNRHETVQKHTEGTRGAVGTSTRAVAGALTSKPQPLLLLRGHILPCCRQHAQKLQKPQLLISKETKMHGFAQVHHLTPAWLSICAVLSKLLTQSAPSPLRDVPCKMTTRHTSLAAAIVVAQQLDGVALHTVHLIAKVTVSVDW